MMIYSIIVYLLLLMLPTAAYAVKAFPTAEGFGADTTTGGRGGRVIFVTNLNDSGPGSFRDCTQATGPRFCIFRVGGVIHTSGITYINSDVTIAGQTAPGEGITITPWPISVSGQHNVIVRHLRQRQGLDDPPPEGQGNNLCGSFIVYGEGSNQVDRVIMDHISAAWACDDTTQTSGYTTNITWQWSIIGDGYEGGRGDAFGSSKGFIVGGNQQEARNSTISFHHNMIIHSANRNPGGGPFKLLDWRYNIGYNSWVYDANIRLGGTDNNIFGDMPANHNFVGNLYIAGPDTNVFGLVGTLREEAQTKIYQFDNDTYKCTPCDPNAWDIGWGNGTTGAVPASESQFRVSTPFAAPAITATSRNMLESVLSGKAGATVPKRDAVDAAMVSELNSRSGGAGRLGAPFPTLPFNNAFKPDDDNDGMPNDWESSHGLNPNSPSDQNTVASNGYTNIENYLNELAGDDIGGEPPIVANANPIYLSVGGHSDSPTDSGDCITPENIATPRATLSAALACMQVPGKILYIRGGTYAGIINTSGGIVVGGTAPAVPTRIEGYQAETAIIQMPVGGINAVEINGTNNITLNKLTIDAMNRTESNALACLDSQGVSVRNSTLRNAFYEVAYVLNCNNLEISKSTLRDTTNAAIITLVGSNTTVKLEELQLLGGTLQGIDAPASATNNSLTIAKNQIRSTGSAGTTPAITLGGGNGALVVNNIIDHNNAGIHIRNTNSGAKILHNAIANNTAIGLQCDSGAVSVIIRNNIIFGNGTDPVANNCGATLASNMTTNPLWVNTALGVRDYHLQETSTAIDVVSPPALPEATTAIDGVSRPVGSLIDLGPYETTASTPVINPTVVKQFIARYLGMFF